MAAYPSGQTFGSRNSVYIGLIPARRHKHTACLYCPVPLVAGAEGWGCMLKIYPKSWVSRHRKVYIILHTYTKQHQNVYRMLVLPELARP